MFPGAVAVPPGHHRGVVWCRDRWPARSCSDRVVAGVCAGLGARLGIDAAIVRIAFVALALGWVGLPVYLLAWIAMPRRAAVPVDGPAPAFIGSGGSPAASGGHQAAGTVFIGSGRLSLSAGTVRRRAAGLAFIVVGAVLLARHLGIGPPDVVIWPVLCAAFGLGVVAWRVHPTAGPRRATTVRIAAGTLLVALGLGFVAAANFSLSVVRDGLLSSGLVVGGLTLILGPWAAVLVRDRREERQRRIRADERAEMAAHLHDSVLQTLALVQRSDDPARMSALARRQERELRGWLYGHGRTTQPSTVRTALDHLAAMVEDRHDTVIDMVVVGDAPLDQATELLVAATGEAMTNAALWSGCSAVSVYAEAAPQAVEVFVRDRGVGFDPDSVEAGCHGIRDSIRGRVLRAGGHCEISSSVGGGTEVRLSLARN